MSGIDFKLYVERDDLDMGLLWTTAELLNRKELELPMEFREIYSCDWGRIKVAPRTAIQLSRDPHQTVLYISRGYTGDKAQVNNFIWRMTDYELYEALDNFYYLLISYNKSVGSNLIPQFFVEIGEENETTNG